MTQQQDNEQLLKAVRQAAREAQVEIANYNEGSHSFQKWVLTLCGVLASAAVIGGITIYGKLAALEERTLNIQQQLNDVKRIVEPRYRGESNP